MELHCSLGYVVTKKEMGENHHGISLAIVTMEKRLINEGEFI